MCRRDVALSRRAESEKVARGTLKNVIIYEVMMEFISRQINEVKHENA